MKRLLVIGLALGLTTGAYAAQDKLEGAEANVQITQQPQAIHVDHDSAVLTWKTDNTAANNVQYRPAGSSEWKHSFLPKGSKDHWMKLTGLQPKTKYEYQILTTSNQVRASGQFETTASGSSSTGSSAPTANSASSDSAQGSSASGDRVPLYRALNPATNTHTYVTDTSQIPPGFKEEGTVGYLMKSKISGTEGVYRLTNPNGDNFYTVDTRERDSAVKMGYTDNGVIGYAATSQLPGTQKLYRLMQNSNNTHFYTNSSTERVNLLKNTSGAWKDEGVSFYVWQ
jgi:hypothetical protein